MGYSQTLAVIRSLTRRKVKETEKCALIIIQIQHNKSLLVITRKPGPSLNSSLLWPDMFVLMKATPNVPPGALFLANKLQNRENVNE